MIVVDFNSNVYFVFDFDVEQVLAKLISVNNFIDMVFVDVSLYFTVKESFL